MNWFYFFLILILFFIWLRIDYQSGKTEQRKKTKKETQIVYNSELELLTNGEQLFEKLLADMKQATDHIHLLFYIIRDDHLGNKVISLLEDKAKEGITVRVLVDKIGADLTRKSRRQMKKAGIQFSYSHPFKFPFFFFSLNQRNHRKIAVIDGTVGYVGGYNIGDEYVGRDPNFGRWRDFHLRLEGDGVQQLQEQFLEDWQVATNETIEGESYYPPLSKGAHPLRLLATNGVYLEETFISLIRQARSSIMIGTPYYIPGEKLQNELIRAAERGVNVRLIVPHHADHPLVKEAAFPYFSDLLEAGVDIFQFYRGFYHVKAVVIDKQMCDIGTANFDKRSFHLNSEMNCLVYDSDFVQSVFDVMEYDLSTSERLTIESLSKRSLYKKGKEKIATLVSGLL